MAVAGKARAKGSVGASAFCSRPGHRLSAIAKMRFPWDAGERTVRYEKEARLSPLFVAISEQRPCRRTPGRNGSIDRPGSAVIPTEVEAGATANGALR